MTSKLVRIRSLVHSAGFFLSRFESTSTHLVVAIDGNGVELSVGS